MIIFEEYVLFYFSPVSTVSHYLEFFSIVQKVDYRICNIHEKIRVFCGGGDSVILGSESP